MASVIDRGAVEAAVRRWIVGPMGLPDVCTFILTNQSDLETGGWSAWYFQGAAQRDGQPATYNLWNRHAGSGRGEWTHASKYVGPGDEDLRIFSGIDQCARDFVELLTDPLYREALAALRRGDAVGYYNALGAAGYAAEAGYAINLTRRYNQEYTA